MLVNKPGEPHKAFERLHSIHKIIICLVIAIGVYMIAGIKNINWLTRFLIGWNTFSLCLLIMTWITFKITTPAEIRKQASVQDSSRVAIFTLILISTFASFLSLMYVQIRNPVGRPIRRNRIIKRKRSILPKENLLVEFIYFFVPARLFF